jgi:MFS transporter, DHA3 family, macrolide efflux protein
VPMLLNFGSSATAGTILSIGGVGTLLGSVVMGIWGGPKRRVPTILALGFLLGGCVMAVGLKSSIPLITIAVFGGMFFFPFISALDEALLLTRVSQAFQGRVFGLLETMTGAAIPLSYLLAGPLVDQIFEPLMAVNGTLASSLGRLIGTGSGRGIGLLFMTLGILQMVVSVIAYTYRPLRALDRAVAAGSNSY